MNFHIFLQARQNSTRFPNKILKEICGKSIFELILERLKKINNSKIFLVTGSLELNQELIQNAKNFGIEYFSGNENNVLDRFHNAASKFESKNIIRITGDCPLIDYKLINDAEKIFDGKKFDLLCNYLPRTYPHGYDFEIFSKQFLETTYNETKKKFSSIENFEKATISPIQQTSESKKFDIYNIKNSKDLSFIRLTLDYLEDFELIKQIYENLYFQDSVFTSEKIMTFIKNNPRLLKLNENFVKFNRKKLDEFFI